MKAFRLYHLLFALGVTASYITAEELGLVHAWLGYGIAVLAALRLLLGVLRSRGFEFRRLLPRFSVPPAGQTGLRHPAIGHGLTLALFACVLGAGGTGIAMDQGGTLVGQSIRADDEKEGGEEEGFSLGLIDTTYADDGEERGEGGDKEEGPLGETHELFGNLLLPLAALHLAWILLFRFDLARFMLFVPKRR